MKKLFRTLLLALAAIAIAACNDPNEQEEILLKITPESLCFEAAGSLQNITLDAPAVWYTEITTGKEWISIEQSFGDMGKGQSIAILVAENTSPEERSGKVAFLCGDESATLTITQKAAVEELPSGPEIPSAKGENTYIINGKEYKFPSTAFMMVGENPALLATPLFGVKGAEKILECSEYFYGAISPSLNGKEFDITTERTLFTFISTLSGAFLESVAPEMTEEVSAGKALFAIDNNTATLKAGMILADGTSIAVNITAKAEERITINENTLSRGDEKKPLRTAFYMNEGGMTYLYFTPAGIDYAEELEIVTWYLYIMIDDNLATGRNIKLDSKEIAQSNLVLGVMDNINGDNSWTITASDLMGATGSILLKKNKEGNYTALLDVLYDGLPYEVRFEGDCISCYDAPVVESNYFLFEGEKSSITSASIDATGSPWSVSLHLASGQSVVVTVPEKFFDGNAHGFSQSADLTVTYGETTFSKANGNSGTITLNLNEEELTLVLSFTNYAGCELEYNGAVTIHQ